MTREISPYLLSIILGFVAFVVPYPIAQAKTPIELLGDQEPALHKLYVQYRSYVPALASYAESQRFTKPVVKLMTIIHEMLHLDAARNQGFFIDGVYYEPYLKREMWPGFENKDLSPYSYPHERGIIWANYVRNTPHNHLGNVVDELNAYGHVMGFICRNEPESTEGQVKNAIGLLHLQEIYLRATRLGRPREYLQLSQTRESVGAMRKVTDRLWKVLQTCGVLPAQIPDAEISYLMRVSESR